MAEIGSEVITVLLTDVVNSTGLWERDYLMMNRRMQDHDALAAEIFAARSGRVLKERGEGDSLVAVFGSPIDALHAVTEFRRRVNEMELEIRAAIHTGEVFSREGDFFGPTLNRCARLRAIANPNQVLLSHAAMLINRDLIVSAFDLENLGEHRLKNLTYPEQIFTIAKDEFGPFAPLASLDAFPHNLPVQPTDFIGRESDLRQVCEAVRKRSLVTLTGTGGIGKTRLAMQSGAELLADFPDGVFFVDLASVEDPKLVPTVIANSIRPGATPDDDVIGDRRMLVILDNCEHLVNAVRAVVADHRNRCPHAHALLTSRVSLDIHGESEIRVPPLSIPDAQCESLDDARAAEAFRMLEDRVGLRAPDVRFENTHVSDLVQILHALDGIPLLIELVAPRFRTLSARQILGYMPQQDRLLNNPAMERDRHRTVHATISTSVDALSPNIQQFFRRLSVYPSGFTLELAQPLSEYPDDPLAASDAVAALYDASLITHDGDFEVTGRCRFLQPIRQFAESQLIESGEADAARAMAFEAIFAWVSQWEGRVVTTSESFHSRESDENATNVEAMLDWGFARDEHKLRAAQLLYNWRSYYVDRHRLTAGRRWVHQALGAIGSDDEYLRAKLLNLNGAMYWLSFEVESAKRCWREAMELFEAAGDTARTQIAQYNLALVTVVQGDAQAGYEYLTQSLHGGDTPAFHAVKHHVLLAIGSACRALGNYDESISYFESLISNPNTPMSFRVMGLANRVRTYMLTGDLNSARIDLQRAIVLLLDCRNDTASSEVMYAAAWVMEQMGADTLAAQCLDCIYLHNIENALQNGFENRELEQAVTQRLAERGVLRNPDTSHLHPPTVLAEVREQLSTISLAKS